MKKKLMEYCLWCLFLLLIGCTARKNDVVPIENSLIINGSFEDDQSEIFSPQGWSVSGDVNNVKVERGGYISKYSYSVSGDQPYVTVLEQEITGLADGIYDLEFYFKNSGGQNACYVAIETEDEKRTMTSLCVSEKFWTQSFVKGVEVTGGVCKVLFYTDANAGNWTKIDGLKLESGNRKVAFLKGGDISELTYLESMGAKYYDDGQEKDCIEILKNNGFNIVRLRLYNDPGNPDYSPSNRLPAGVQNPDDILSLASRAKAVGMQIQLTFHYSDYWTNGITQHKPHDWEGLGYEDLKSAVYDFTYDFMAKMKAQGTTPEYVSLGNETVGGILFPDGSTDNFKQLAELFNEGYGAVKAISPETQVMIHLDAAGDKYKYDWYFDELNRNGGKYDLIGASYYPFWTRITAGEMREWAEYTIDKFDKDIFIMETGYNWNPVRLNGWEGQLKDNGPYDNVYPSSPQGQKDYLLELFTEIKKERHGRVLGCLYWDPIMIEVPGVGWELGAQNYVSNTTLFDFDGKSLKSLDAFKYNN